MQLGDYRVEIIPDTEFRLDGGAMFGVVPRVVWERVSPPDEKNRIRHRGEPEIPSNTFAYFFREALRRIWVSKRTSFVAVAMIAISLLTVGAFLLIAENLGRAAARWQGKSRIVIYFDPAATPQQMGAVDSFLAARPELGRIWKALMGRHFPAMSMIFVTDLLDAPGKIELEATAVIPEENR